jgi:hypothetical protein
MCKISITVSVIDPLNFPELFTFSLVATQGILIVKSNFISYPD